MSRTGSRKDGPRRNFRGEQYGGARQFVPRRRRCARRAFVAPRRMDTFAASCRGANLLLCDRELRDAANVIINDRVRNLKAGLL